MDQILAHYNGVICIADDVVVHGKDDEEHDKCLHKFIRVTDEHGLVFNKDKCAAKQTPIVSFGCVYDANGANADPERSVLSTRCQYLRQQLNYRRSSDW